MGSSCTTPSKPMVVTAAGPSATQLKSSRAETGGTRLAGKAAALSPTEEKMKVTKLGTYNIKTADDTEPCWITSMTITLDDRRLMSDCGNCKVKMFSRSMALLSSLKMTDDPWAIGLVDDEEVVVSVSAERIIILDISNNSIQLKRTKELTFKVDGIAAYKDKLIIGSLSFPFSVKMIDKYSKICWSVSSDERGFSLFRYPSYVTIASNNYEGSRSSSATITDYGIKAITLLNSDTGTITSRREVLAKRPKGVTCDIAGIVFVCNSNVS